METDIQVHEVKGAWVEEPFVTFGTAKMVLYEDHKRIVDELKIKIATLTCECDICVADREQLKREGQ